MKNRTGRVFLSGLLPLCAVLRRACPRPRFDRQAGTQRRRKNPLDKFYFGEQHQHAQNLFDAFRISARQIWEDV